MLKPYSTTIVSKPIRVSEQLTMVLERLRRGCFNTQKVKGQAVGIVRRSRTNGTADAVPPIALLPKSGAIANTYMLLKAAQSFVLSFPYYSAFFNKVSSTSLPKADPQHHQTT